jgi:hypothetical protein
MATIEIPKWANNSEINIIYQKTNPNYSGRCMAFVIFDENRPELGGAKVKSRSISLSSNQRFPGSSILFEVSEINFGDPSNCTQQIIIHAVDDPLIEVCYNRDGQLHEKMEFGKQFEKEEEIRALRSLGHFDHRKLPKKIDFDRTVQSFLSQVENKDFSMPKLIIPSKK